jgi:hypothetical protein
MSKRILGVEDQEDTGLPRDLVRGGFIWKAG